MEISDNPKRKTKYSKNEKMVNIDSKSLNRFAYEALRQGRVSEIGIVSNFKKEVTYSNSRFDLYYEQGT